MQRVFDFTGTAFVHDFRPYIARLNLSSYTEVLYPTPSGTLATLNASACPGGCTGPVAAPGAAQLNPPWDSREGWFAFHDPTTLQGVVVNRVPSIDPQGSVIAAQLWIDYDDASSPSNASSFLLMNPEAGFQGGLVAEAETLCFYNSTIWTPSLIPPPACRNGPAILMPWNLTFSGQGVASTSAPQTAILRNAGAESVVIAGIVASGDFAQTNNCPASLSSEAVCSIIVTFSPVATGIRSGSLSIVDSLAGSPQTLTLDGIGLPQ